MSMTAPVCKLCGHAHWNSTEHEWGDSPAKKADAPAPAMAKGKPAPKPAVEAKRKAKPRKPQAVPT